MDILRILGPNKVKVSLNEIQEVYRLQGVKIDDKHIDYSSSDDAKVSIDEPGDSNFLPKVDKQADFSKLTKNYQQWL